MYSWDERSTREAVKGRSGGICESCCAARATDMHHRKSRGVGGKWSPANMAHLCRPCHRWVTDNPQKSYNLGLSLRSYQNPEDISITNALGGVSLLSDDVAPP